MKAPRKNALEWAVFFVSLVLIGAVVAALVMFEVQRTDTPPALHVSVDGGRRAGDGYAVRVVVENRGGRTAANVSVEVAIEGSANAERGELVLPFVPHGARRNGEVMFTREPPAGALRARILGYEIP
jgi:uncharacterized protein (TIGR02588 family)